MFDTGEKCVDCLVGLTVFWGDVEKKTGKREYHMMSNQRVILGIVGSVQNVQKKGGVNVRTEEEIEKALKKLRENYQYIFNTDEGKEVLSDLEKRCHYHSTTNVKGDSHESAYMEGQRSVLLFIKQMLQKENKNVK